MDRAWLKWGTPILAAITALLEAAHEGNLFSSEVLVLIFAILTAIGAFAAAIRSPETEPPPVQQFKAPEPPQQTPTPTGKK